MPQTVGDFIRQGAARFRAARIAFGHGTLNASDEAAWLAAHAMRVSPDELASRLEVIPDPGTRKRILELYRRRIKERIPAAYLTGEAWLGSFRFRIDERVIIPRSYIAELLQNDLAPWIARPSSIRSALDLCTGSGCLAVLLANSFRRAAIDAADISRDALAVARGNVAAHGLRRRIRIVTSDLFSALSGSRYDLIVSNPPYVRTSAMRRLPPEYRKEPALALAAGRDGLDLVRRILHVAAAYLKPGGLLVVEVGRNRAALERAYPRLEFAWPDLSDGEPCVFVLRREQLPPGALTAGPAIS